MNIYSFLPLFGLFANLFLCFYILYINPKNKLNQLFGFLTFSLALWSFGTFYMFTSSSISEAFFWNNISTTGTVFTAVFMLQFSVVYCKKDIIKSKLFLISLYFIGFVFIIIESTTNLITKSMRSIYWGYSENPGVLFPVLSLFIILSVLISFLLYYQLQKSALSDKIKKQSRYLIIAFLIPLIGGVFTQVIAPYIGLEIMPLTSTLTTFTAVIIGFTVFKHNLLKPNSFSIQKKIVTMFFILLFCINFFSLTTTGFISNDIINESVDENLNSIAQFRADHVKTLINQDIERLQLVSSRTKLRMSLESYNNHSNHNDKNIIYENLMDANESITDFQDIFIINLSGFCIFSTDSDYENKSYTNEDYFLKGKTNDTFNFLLYRDIPKIFLSGPLIYNEKLLGVIVVVSKPDLFFEVMSDTNGLGETGEAYILDESGYVLTPLRKYNYSYNVNNVILRKKVISDNYRNCLLHKNKSFDKCQDEVKIFENYDDKKVLATHFYISEMQWCLLVEIEEQEAYASVNNMQNLLTIVLSVSAVIFLFIAFFYSKTISDPIKKLDEYAKEISEGNLNINVDIKTSDEVGSLAESFNKMTKSLKKHAENVEQQVNERTKEMQEKVSELERFKKVTVGRELRMVELKKPIKQLQNKKQLEGDNFDA